MRSPCFSSLTEFDGLPVTTAPRRLLAAPFTAGCIVSDVAHAGSLGPRSPAPVAGAGDPRPLLLMTGHGDVELAVQAIKLGAFDFVEKPFSNERLARER